MLVDRARSQLLVVDVQERLLPAMAEPDQVSRGCALLMTAAARLDIPITVSEQYPKGLGPTVPALAELVPENRVLAKLDFSCAADPAIRDRLETEGRPQIVVAGIEAHVCVLMTAMQLVEAGHEVFVVADAVSSRRQGSADLALDRLRAAGVSAVNAEMVLFEWLRRAGTEEFKEISKLIK